MPVARVQTTSPRRRRQPRDGCVVPTDPLADLVRGFLAAWSRDRPANHGRFSDDQAVTFVGGEEWLAAESGLPRDKIQSVRQRRQPQTELYVADALTAAIGRPDVLCALPVSPNPKASRAARESCCGGATFA